MPVVVIERLIHGFATAERLPRVRTPEFVVRCTAQKAFVRFADGTYLGEQVAFRL